MFGHQDHPADDTQHIEPVPDATLSSNNTSMVMPPSAPVAEPFQPTPSAPAIDDAAASDYIMTNAPHADGDSIPAVAGDPSTDELLNIKQHALQDLSPLVSHLDQTPEEKFRTTMMMIQGSDDQSMIPTAYEAAKQISDEKVRAQALLDVVNEINYFTQHQADKPAA
jgi:hypothetical protein